MSGNRFVWNGLEELKAQLRSLPADLTGEASEIVRDTGAAAADEVRAGYPSRASDLRDHVTVTFTTSGYATGAVVKNTSKLAYIFENGTMARHYFTRRGVRHLTGRMPPGHVFVPIMVRRRRAMYAQLADLLTRHGLTVSGTP